MKHLLLIGIASIAAFGPVFAADKPNFSGEWRLNVDKSDYGTIPAPTALTRVVTHAEPSLTIVDKQTGGYGGDSTSTRTLSVDGQTHKYQTKGAEVESAVDWKDNALHAITLIKVAQLTYDDTMALSADGKVLTSTVEVSSPRGDIEIIMVFDRL